MLSIGLNAIQYMTESGSLVTLFSMSLPLAVYPYYTKGEGRGESPQLGEACALCERSVEPKG